MDETNTRPTYGGIPSLHSWFADGGDGLLFDFTKTDRFFQENTGPTLADDVGESIGLALDQHSWAGKTLAELVSAQSELRGTGALALAGSATAATYNTSTGVGTATRVDASNQSAVSFAVTSGRTYEIDLQVSSGADALIRSGTSPALSSTLGGVANGNRTKLRVLATAAFIFIASDTNGTTTGFTVHSIKEIPGNHGTQSSATLKPTRQTSGAKFDGSDDNLLTTYLAGSGANSIVALVTVPETIAAVQVIAGATASITTRCYLGLSINGKLYCGAGSTILNGNTDLRGQTLVVGLSISDGNGVLYADAAVGSTGTYSDSPTTTIAFRVGALANGISATNSFGGSIKKLMTLRKAITLADYLKIRARMLID